MRIASALVGILGILVVNGCGSDASSSTPSGTPSSGNADAGGAGSGGGTDGGGGGTPGADSGTAGGGDDAGKTVPTGSAGYAFGTYIVLGDSISDRGGEAPFFYELLNKNDDATYPTWKGHDLATRYPGITYVHGAVAGAETTVYTDQKAGAFSTLVDQVKALNSNYPGDVFITITIGGNDLNSHATAAILDPASDQKNRDQLATALKGALTELTTPKRLGNGKVLIVEANVYDASDGQGTWGTVGKCGPKVDTGKATDTKVFQAWNDVIANAISSVGEQDRALDLHGLFFGHGFTSTDRWFATDCLHPVKKGHNVIRAEAWRILTGETIQ